MPSYTIFFVFVAAVIGVRGGRLEIYQPSFECWCGDSCPEVFCTNVGGCSPVTCQCGNVTLAQDPEDPVNQRCCVPSTCESPGVCLQGHVIPASEFCENQENPSVRCYNSYPESEKISELSNFACPDISLYIRCIYLSCKRSI